MIDNNPLEIIDSTNGKEKMISGVIIRHLYLPGRFAETADVLDFLKQNADGKACISLMNQYTPIPAKKGKIVVQFRQERIMKFVKITERLQRLQIGYTKTEIYDILSKVIRKEEEDIV